MLSDWKSGEEKITEPNKFIAMEWRDFDSLPDPLFLPWQQLLNSQFIDSMKDDLAKSR